MPSSGTAAAARDLEATATASGEAGEGHGAAGEAAARRRLHRGQPGIGERAVALGRSADGEIGGGARLRRLCIEPVDGEAAGGQGAGGDGAVNGGGAEQVGQCGADVGGADPYVVGAEPLDAAGDVGGLLAIGRAERDACIGAAAGADGGERGGGGHVRRGKGELAGDEAFGVLGQVAFEQGRTGREAQPAEAAAGVAAAEVAHQGHRRAVEAGIAVERAGQRAGLRQRAGEAEAGAVQRLAGEGGPAALRR